MSREGTPSNDPLELRWLDFDNALDEEVLLEEGEISMRQYATWLEVARRWKIYDFAEQKVDRLEDVIKKYMEIGVQPHHRFLDVGCLRPDLLVDLRLLHGFGGRMVGVDPNPTFFFIAEHLLDKEGGRPIEFGVGRVEDLNNVWAHEPEGSPPQLLEIGDGEFDVVQAFRMLYEPQDPWQALLNLGAKVKPGGILAVSTSGHYNKDIQRAQELGGARYLSDKFQPTEPPPRFNERFDTFIAGEMLPRLPGFTIEDGIEQDTVVHVTASETGDGTYDAHETSFDSMMSAYRPVPRGGEWLAMKEEYFHPAMRRAIKRGGGHVDVKIQQHWYFLRKAA